MRGPSEQRPIGKNLPVTSRQARTVGVGFLIRLFLGALLLTGVAAAAVWLGLTRSPAALRTLLFAIACYAGAIGGGLALLGVLAARGLDPPVFRLTTAGWLIALWAVSFAGALWQQSNPVALLLAAALPPLAAVAVVSRRRGPVTTWQRALLVLGVVSFIATPLAAALEALPFAALLLLRPNLRPELPFADGAAALARFLFGPLGPLLAIEAVLAGPLLEEVLKPLPAYVLGRRLRSAAEAFLLGMIGGAAFAIVENLAYLGLTLDERAPWAANALLRLVSGALHPVASGLVAVGFYAWRYEGRGDRLLRNFAVAFGLHALWNAIAGGLLLFAVRLSGLAQPSALAALLLLALLLGLIALGLLLWLGLENLARFATRGARDVLPAQEEAPTAGG